MRYMFLIYNSEATRAAATPAEIDACAQAHQDLIQETVRRGVLRDAAPLYPTGSATTVRKQKGSQPLIIDGPFAETKEQLGGYYILECADLNEALDWAGKIPTVCSAGCVEVRPIDQLGA